MPAAGFDPRFAGTKIPTLDECARLGEAHRTWVVVLEIKEAERPDARRRLGLPRSSNPTGYQRPVIVISFDHAVLKRAVDRHPGLRTEAITHARHVDLLGVLKACGASSVSIELDMFNPDDGRKLHEAGFSNRVHVPRPEVLAEYWRGGRDPLPDLVQWIKDGLIDTISGDDVPFIARLVQRAGKAG